MLQKIVQILKENNDVSAYKIVENVTESDELFFVKRALDMNRGKKVHYYTVTVYRDFEEDGKKFRGDSQIKLHPTMNEDEIKKAINEAAFAAQFVKNQYYPLASTVKADLESREFEKDKSNEIISEAIFRYDKEEKPIINACEVFWNKEYVRIINSEGVDVEYKKNSGDCEVITTWKNHREEVELFRNLRFAEIDSEAISNDIKNRIDMTKERAESVPTPKVKDIPVIISGDPVKEFFRYYSIRSKASSVWDKISTWKIGDNVQGEKVKGDKITLSLQPIMNNSTHSQPFDKDGFKLEPVTLIEEGTLKRYCGDVRYSHYLGIEPTGDIKNIKVNGGSKSYDEFTQNPYLEAVEFSSFQVDMLTGDFGGEIRLGWYFDGEKKIAISGGAITGSINELEEMYLSKEIQKDDNFEIPKAVRIKNVSITPAQ